MHSASAINGRLAGYGLSLPRFTSGVEMVRLVEHRTVEELHQELLARLEPWGVTIARREVLSLFDADCTWLWAASAAHEDQEWFAQVEKNGGIMVSIDGTLPDKGHETVSLVRDALSGRVLVAEHGRSSETAVRKALVAPVVALGVKVLGTISGLALQELWPEVPIRGVRSMRDAMPPGPPLKRTTRRKRPSANASTRSVRKVRTQIKKALETADVCDGPGKPAGGGDGSQSPERAQKQSAP